MSDHRGERVLWLAIYVACVCAPTALMLVSGISKTLSAPTVVAASLGFSALVMLALQLVMPSRAGSFTIPFGIGVLVRFHRQIGMVSLALVIAHVVVLMVDDPDRLQLLLPHTAPWRAQAGMLAMLALVALIVTTVRRGALRYEHWRAIHLGLGAVVLVASCAHAVGVSRYLAVAPIRWGVLVAAAVAAAAVFYLRVGRPFSAAAAPYTLVETRAEGAGATTLVLQASGKAVPFEAGQFAWLKLAHAPYSLTEHPFSFSGSATRPDHPEFTIRAVGDFTDMLASLEPGTPLLLDGPHGRLRDDGRRGWVLICGGVGITPAMSLLKTMAETGDRRPVVLVYASRHENEIIFDSSLAELADALDLRVIHVISRPGPSWTGERGRIDERLLDRVLPADRAQYQALVCANPAMTRAMRDALIAAGLPRDSVQIEDFG